MYNVIDSRQAYLQQLLKQALDTMGFREEAAHSTHVSYEMVALSHATARALVYADTEADGKPFVEVSGRKGLGVKADDLIDQMIATARSEGAWRHADLSDDGLRPHRGDDRDRGAPVLPGEVFARPRHRIRYRRGVEL